MRKKHGNSPVYVLSYQEASLIDFVLNRHELKRLYDAARTNDLVNKLKSTDLNDNIASVVESLYCAKCYEFKLENGELVDRYGMAHMRSEEEAISFIKKVHTSDPQAHTSINVTTNILQTKASFPKIAALTSSVIRECNGRECIRRRLSFGGGSSSHAVHVPTTTVKKSNDTSDNDSDSSNSNDEEEKKDSSSDISKESGSQKRKRSDIEDIREQLEKKVDMLSKYNESIVSNLNFIIKNLNENIEHLKERLKMQECDHKLKTDQMTQFINQQQVQINNLRGVNANKSMNTIQTTSR